MTFEFCPFCGKPIPFQNATFCPSCGKALEHTGTTPQTPLPAFAEPVTPVGSFPSDAMLSPNTPTPEMVQQVIRSAAPPFTPSVPHISNIPQSSTDGTPTNISQGASLGTNSRTLWGTVGITSVAINVFFIIQRLAFYRGIDGLFFVMLSFALALAIIAGYRLAVLQLRQLSLRVTWLATAILIGVILVLTPFFVLLIEDFVSSQVYQFPFYWSNYWDDIRITSIDQFGYVLPLLILFIIALASAISIGGAWPTTLPSERQTQPFHWQDSLISFLGSTIIFSVLFAISDAIGTALAKQNQSNNFFIPLISEMLTLSIFAAIGFWTYRSICAKR